MVAEAQVQRQQEQLDAENLEATDKLCDDSESLGTWHAG